MNSTESIVKRSILSQTPAGDFPVMHPLDVLQGRLENGYGLAQKPDEHGIAQLQLAITMAREFLRDVASQETARAVESGLRVTLRHVRRIEALALSDAGRKLAKRHGIPIADALDPSPMLHLRAFATRKFPQLLKLMSPARRAQLATAPPLA